jgi:hypothetical protein
MIVIVGAVPAVWICLDLFEVSFSSWNLALFACISSFLDCTGVHLLFFFYCPYLLLKGSFPLVNGRLLDRATMTIIQSIACLSGVNMEHLSIGNFAVCSVNGIHGRSTDKLLQIMQFEASSDKLIRSHFYQTLVLGLPKWRSSTTEQDKSPSLFEERELTAVSKLPEERRTFAIVFVPMFTRAATMACARTSTAACTIRTDPIASQEENAQSSPAIRLQKSRYQALVHVIPSSPS